MTTINKIEEGRAAYAFTAVKKAVNDSNIDNKELRSYIKKMPTMIQVNGLGQTLAFYYSKKDSNRRQNQYQVVYKMVAEWILKYKYPHLSENYTDDLVECVINLDSKQYKLVTNEVMSLLNWLRRFVEGMTKENDEVE